MSTDREIARTLHELFRTFNEKPDAAAQMIRVYGAELQSYPLAYIEKAAMRFRNGAVTRLSHVYTPKIPEMHVEIRRLMDEDAEHERLTTPRLAAPAEPNPKATLTGEERATVVERVLRANPPIDDANLARRETIENQRRDARKAANDKHLSKIVAECEAAGVDAYEGGGGEFPVSLSLRKLMAERPPAGSR